MHFTTQLAALVAALSLCTPALQAAGFQAREELCLRIGSAPVLIECADNGFVLSNSAAKSVVSVRLGCVQVNGDTILVHNCGELVACDLPPTVPRLPGPRRVLITGASHGFPDACSSGRLAVVEVTFADGSSWAAIHDLPCEVRPPN